MTITTLNTTICEEATTPSSAERISLWQLPKVVWLGTALLLANSAVGIGMMNSKTIVPDLYGAEVSASSATGSKPSPFAQAVDTRRSVVRKPAKLIPVQFEAVPTDSLGGMYGSSASGEAGFDSFVDQ